MFRRGADIKPFAGTSQEPYLLLQQVTPLELASAVPFVKITKIDFRTGKAGPDAPAITYDLMAAPAAFAQFGDSGDSFLERSNVSLNSMVAKSIYPNGDIMEREVTLSFTVHNPAVVFDRSSRLAWRQILEEGNTFILEYGWKADPIACQNPLFNGFGHVSRSGVVTLSTRQVLMYVYRWNVGWQPDGQLQVTVNAMESGDAALRDARFSDAYELTFGKADVSFGVIPRASSDAENSRRLRELIDGLPRRQLRGRTDAVTMGDILDGIVAPMVDRVMRQYTGYDAGSPVEFLLGNFNDRVGRQSEQQGSGVPRSIGDFIVPLSQLRELVSFDLAKGRAMTLQNFIRIVIGIMNSGGSWLNEADRVRPLVGLKLSTVQTDGGLRLVFALFDRRSISDALGGLERLPLDMQTPDDIRRALRSADVPLIEFGRANSAIVDASFEMQTNPMLQSIQIESAAPDRKDRVQTTAVPDIETRRGHAGQKDIMPISIVEGDLTLIGNFVFDIPCRAWVDFFGSPSISGIFNVLEQTDTLESGKFTTQLHMISEGLDPLNTRQKLTSDELATRRR